MKGRTSVALITAAITMAVSASLAMGRIVPPAEYLEVMQVVNSTELSDAQKIARLKEYAGAQDTRMFALLQLERLDFKEAMDTALAAFRAKDAPGQLKLRLGRFMLQGNRPQRAGFPESFVEEFAQFLVAAILDGGQREFSQKLDGLSLTAVGEYAYLASDFQGYQRVDFAPFKDARVVPVLIQCLDAPDNVYPKDQGDLIRGKSGESTGRNTARQQIPIALARLGDVQAVEPLKAVLFKHHDIYGRMNAAYALARLLTRKEDRAAVGKEILAKPELLWCRLPFGKGLIESGDDAGVEFLAIEHAGGYGRLEYPSEILYMLNQRLSVLRGLKSPKVEGFIREALAFKPLRALVLFEPGSAKMRPREYYLGNPPKDEAEELERVAKQVMKTYSELLKCVETNGFKGLSADLEEIAKQTRNEEIRTMTNACLKSLASTPAAEGK